jgi:hypothetical protein
MPDEKTQVQKFREAALQMVADEEARRLRERLKAVVKREPPKDS